MLKAKDSTTISTSLTLHHRKAIATGVLCALVCSAAPALADPPVYSLVPVNLPAGFTIPFQVTGGISNQGDIALTATSAGSNARHGFVWKYVNRRAYELGTLGGSFSGAAAINDCGEAVGFAALKGDALSHAALFRRGNVVDLDPQGTTASFATGINNGGKVVGARFVAKDNGNHPVIFENRTVRDLTGQTGEAVGINLSGEIAGFNNESEANQFLPDSFVIKNGQITTFAHTSAQFTAAVAINDFGDVLGEASQGPTSGTVSFVFQDGQIFDLPLSNFARRHDPRAFNNSGEAVGTLISQNPTIPPQGSLIRGHILYTLNDLVDPADPLAKVVSLTEGFGINDSGWIAAKGTDSRDQQAHIYLLKRATPAIQVRRVHGGCPVADGED